MKLVLLSIALLLPAQIHASNFLASLEAGPETLGGQSYATIVAGLSYDSPSLAAEIDAPLRLGLQHQPGHAGILRQKDWDALSDAGRVLKKLEISLEERTLVIHFGALAHQSLGHGVIVNDLTNSLLPDEQPVGLATRLVYGSLALDALTPDMLAFGFQAATVTIEPFSIFGKTNDRVHLLFSAAADWNIPTVASRQKAVVYGFGADWAFLRSELLKVAPYFDLNSTAEGGYGLHLGILSDFSFKFADVSFKTEFRRIESPYQPEYFDIAYPVERSSALVADQRNLTSLTGNSSQGSIGKLASSSGTANSFRAEARLQAKFIALSAAVSSRGKNPLNQTPVKDASLKASVDTAKLQIACMVAARQFDWGKNPARTFLVSEARYRVTPFIHFWAMAGRLYRIEGLQSEGEGGASAASLNPIAVTQLGLGIGGAFGF